jgi:hypothetical protein
LSFPVAWTSKSKSDPAIRTLTIESKEVIPCASFSLS